MRLSSKIDMDNSSTEILNPVYEAKVISCFIKALTRFIDILAGLLGTFLLIPISLYVIIEKIIKNEQGPVLYYHTRVGKNGKTFKMYRLNTKSILCEFPQFINVLAGTMTLVGPRPYTIRQEEQMGDYFNIISKVKPGITGIYQISGRSVGFNERLDLDVHYILNRSLKLDFKIILITLFVTLKNKKSIYYQKYVYEEIPRETVNNYILRNTRLFIKRIVDIIGGIIGTILLLPLTAIMFIGNKICKDNGPVFYSQERIGKDGKAFKMYKYRSMVVGADDVLNDLLQQDEIARKEYKKYKKLKNDPRVTKMGSFLRKTSLDEFPQFINVLKGDISLVGPRAYLPREKEDMGEKYDKIIRVKPGLTGLWQVNGRNQTTFEDRLNIDIEYSHKFNLWLDIKIILRTIMKVVKREGAV